VFTHFTHLVANASGWAYAILFLFALLDVAVPAVPSETAVITAGVVASQSGLSLPLVILSAAAGAFAGDNIVYWVGRRYGTRINDRFFTSEKARGRVEWAHGQLQQRGGQLIVIGRFIPAGRTAVTISAGTLEYPYRKFVLFDILAAAIWGSYAALLGYFGGHAFEKQPWKGLLLAFAVAFAVTGAIELVRWLIRRRRGQSTTT
jgi:membrane protein DedA with SNARE-associated domain